MSIEFFARTKRIFPNATRGREIVTMLYQNRNEKCQSLTTDQIETMAVRGGKESAILYLMSLNPDKRAWIYDQIKHEEHHCFDRITDCICSEEWRFHRFFATQRCTSTVCGPKKGNMGRLQKLYKADFPEETEGLFDKAKTREVGSPHFFLLYTPYCLFPLNLYESTLNRMLRCYSGLRKKAGSKLTKIRKRASKCYAQAYNKLVSFSYIKQKSIYYPASGSAFGGLAPYYRLQRFNA